MAQHEWDALLNWDSCTQTLHDRLEEIQNNSTDCQSQSTTLYEGMPGPRGKMGVVSALSVMHINTSRHNTEQFTNTFGQIFPPVDNKKVANVIKAT